MSYVLHDVLVNPLPDRQTYIDLCTTALATPSDDELDAATPASWLSTSLRLWVLALARELKACATQKHEVLSIEYPVTTHHRYSTVNLGFKNQNTNFEAYMERMMTLVIIPHTANWAYGGYSC